MSEDNPVSSGNALADAIAWISNLGKSAPAQPASTYMGDAPKGQVPAPVKDAYGTGNEGYVSGQVANMPNFKANKNLDPLNPGPDDFKAFDVSKTKNPNKYLLDVINSSQQGQAGANVNALVGLGFDPRQVQAVGDYGPTTDGGSYTPKTDKIWDNTNDPYTILHESMHRGLQKLRDANAMPPEGVRMLNAAGEEMVVRHMMQNQFGPTESNYLNNLAQKLNISDVESMDGMKEIRASDRIFKSNSSSVNDKAIQSILDAAAKLNAKTRPGGPR